MATTESKHTTPKAFISYSWDDDRHREWVRQFAERLRKDGVNVTLDQWDAAPGDQIPAFMERAVRENDFVVAICTPRFKDRSDSRGGGVGYEGDIMTAYAFIGGGKKKFIPVLRRGSWMEAAPTWLLGRVSVDLRGDPYSESEYNELLRTLHGARKAAPPIGDRPHFEDTDVLQASACATPTDPVAGLSTAEHQSEAAFVSDMGSGRRGVLPSSAVKNKSDRSIKRSAIITLALSGVLVVTCALAFLIFSPGKVVVLGQIVHRGETVKAPFVVRFSPLPVEHRIKAGQFEVELPRAALGSKLSAYAENEVFETASPVEFTVKRNSFVKIEVAYRAERKRLTISQLNVERLKGRTLTSLGVVGSSTDWAEMGDSAKISASLSEAAHAMMLAFNPGGTVEVCSPGSADAEPVVSKEIIYPVELELAYRFTDGVGGQAFAVVCSSKPLPRFRDWTIARELQANWRTTSWDGVWEYRDRKLRRLDNELGTGPVVEVGMQPFIRVCDILAEATGVESVRVIGFPVTAASPSTGKENGLHERRPQKEAEPTSNGH